MNNSSQDSIFDLIAGVERMASLSAQAVDRQRLIQAAPALVALLDESIAVNKIDAGQLNAVLCQIWPNDQLIRELDEDYVHDSFDEIKIFDIESDGFDRSMKIAPDLVFVGAMRKDTSTSKAEDEDGEVFEFNDHREDVFALVSPRIAIKYQSIRGDFSDEEFDTSLKGEIFLTENPQQMQSLVRQEMKTMAMTTEDLERKLSFAFGRSYSINDVSPNRVPKP